MNHINLAPGIRFKRILKPLREQYVPVVFVPPLWRRIWNWLVE